MPSFKAVQSQQNISLDSTWKDAVKFNSKDRVVTKEGREYRIIAKKEREFSCIERGFRGFLGLVAAVMTLGYLFSSKMVRELLFDSKETRRFAVLVGSPSELSDSGAPVYSQFRGRRSLNPSTPAPSHNWTLGGPRSGAPAPSHNWRIGGSNSKLEPLIGGVYGLSEVPTTSYFLAVVDGKITSFEKQLFGSGKPVDIDPMKVFVKKLQSESDKGVKRENGEGYESPLSIMLDHPSNTLFTKDELVAKLKEKDENGVPLLFTLNAINLLDAINILSETEVQITADNGDNLLHVLAKRKDKDTLEKLINAHPSLLNSSKSLLLEVSRDPWKKVWNFLLDFYAEKTIAFTEFELLAKKVLKGGPVTKNEFNALSDENKKKIFCVANTHANEAVVNNLKKWGMGEKPIYRFPDFDITSANMDFVQVREVVTNYFKSLHERGLILTREEFNKLDRRKFYDKGDDIGRIAGRDFVEKVAKENNLTMIKAPRKIIVVDGDKETLRVRVTPRGEIIPLDENLKVTVYAERVPVIDGFDIKDLKIAREMMIALEKTGYNDFGGQNFFHNEEGIHFIDTEFHNFDPDRPVFDQIMAEKDLAGTDNEEAYLNEFAERIIAFADKEKEREERLAKYSEMSKDPWRNLMGGSRNIFEIPLPRK